MRIFILSALLFSMFFANNLESPKYSIDQVKQTVKELQTRLNDCKFDEKTDELSNRLEEMFEPINSVEFKEYDERYISQLRRINEQNLSFLTAFLMSKKCDSSDNNNTQNLN